MIIINYKASLKSIKKSSLRRLIIYKVILELLVNSNIASGFIVVIPSLLIDFVSLAKDTNSSYVNLWLTSKHKANNPHNFGIAQL